jgi:hypothetical protein
MKSANDLLKVNARIESVNGPQPDADESPMNVGSSETCYPCRNCEAFQEGQEFNRKKSPHFDGAKSN